MIAIRFDRCVLAAVLSLAAPLTGAVPLVQSTQAFTDLVGPNPYLAAGWRFVVGANNVTPAGPGTTVSAIHVPVDAAQDVAEVPAAPSPMAPNAYFANLAYAAQSGQWQIRATDASGTGVATTHLLDDVRELPLVHGLAASGDLLAPIVHWDRMDPLLYPSYCMAPCAVGFDFFNYGVIVRSTSGTLLYQSAVIPNVESTPTDWALPLGLLAPEQTYLIGVRLTMNELESIRPDGSFVSPLENRSSAYLEYRTAPVPEPATSLLALGGGSLLCALARRRSRPGA